MIPKSVTAELTKDSSNVIDIISTSYKTLREKVRLLYFFCFTLSFVYKYEIKCIVCSQFVKV